MSQDRLRLIRERMEAARSKPAAEPKRRILRGDVRVCRCGCSGVLNPDYLSPYLPGHRGTSEERLCVCGCQRPLPEGVRYRRFPGHYYNAKPRPKR